MRFELNRLFVVVTTQWKEQLEEENGPLIFQPMICFSNYSRTCSSEENSLCQVNLCRQNVHSKNWDKWPLAHDTSAGRLKAYRGEPDLSRNPNETCLRWDQSRPLPFTSALQSLPQGSRPQKWRPSSHTRVCRRHAPIYTPATRAGCRQKPKSSVINALWLFDICVSSLSEVWGHSSWSRVKDVFKMIRFGSVSCPIALIYVGWFFHCCVCEYWFLKTHLFIT